MKFQVGGFFKVTSNGNAGLITAIRTRLIKGEEPVTSYKVIWAHLAKKNPCNYAVVGADALWEKSTEAYFDSRPIVTPTPPPRRKEVSDAADALDYALANGLAKTDDGKLTINLPQPPKDGYTYKIHRLHANPDECNHAFQKYVGFTQSFEFCTKCDHKKEIPK